MASDIDAEKQITVPDMPALLKRLHSRVSTPLRASSLSRTTCSGLIWCDPFVAAVRSYNIALAVDAAKAGFDEIEFDYVRFPDAKGVVFSEPTNDSSRPKAIDTFLTEARDNLIPYNVFLSADVFGYICWNKGDTGIGQKIEDVVGPLDYVSPMLYPSGFTYGIPNYRNPVDHRTKSCVSR